MPHLRDGFYLADPDIEDLRRHLTRVTTIVDNYAITLTSQDRVRPPALGGKAGKAKLEEMCPLNVEARDRLDRLANELGTVARDMCETRGITYDGDEHLLGVARWLRINVIALALMPAAEELRDGIVRAIDRCMEVVDLPTERSMVIDRDRIAAANRSVLDEHGVEVMARRLGDLGKGLTAARVRSLRKHAQRCTVEACAAHHLEPVSRDPDTGKLFYRLGHVLDAHHSIGRRGKIGA